MSMSKKDCGAIAAILRPHNTDGGSQVSDEITVALAQHFERDNPAFDKQRFLSAAAFEVGS